MTRRFESILMPATSPCVNICVMDAPTGLCAGCGRTLAEIGQWSSLSEAERQAILKVLPGRMDANVLVDGPVEC